MAIQRFLPRASNVNSAVQWTGSNTQDIEDLLTQWGWSPTAISEAVSVTGNVLTVSGTEVQPDQWYGFGMSAVDSAVVEESYQEVTGTGPFAYVLDDEGA